MVIVLAVLAVAVSCSSERGKVIPRSKLAKIYAEMLLRDQWINSHLTYSRMADTSFVYRPILEKYGCNEADYRRSVEKYIKDPDRYSRILKKSADILKARQSKLQDLKNRYDAIGSLDLDTVNYFPEKMFYLAGMRNPTNRIDFGGIVFYVDSIGGHEWLFDPAAGFDTLFHGPCIEIVLKDTLSLDSLAVVDSLARLDSLARIDSLAVVDSLASVVDSVVAIEGEKLILDDEITDFGKFDR